MNKYYIDEVWPISTKVVPNGGIGINWSGPIGFGKCVIYWDNNKKLHADTECLSNNEDKKFLKTILTLLTDSIEVDK